MRSRIGFSVFATAIAVSAVAHALVLTTFRVVRIEVSHAPAAYSEMSVVYREPEAEPSVPDGSEFEIGEPLGKGYATHDLAGRREQMAREAPQDQPSLSLDPVGSSRVVEVPSAPIEMSVNPAPVVPSAVPGAGANEIPPATPLLPPEVEQSLRRDRIEAAAVPVPFDLPSPAHGAEAATVPPVVELSIPQAVPQQPPALAQATPRSPVAGTGADPAPQSDSESDAFSVLGSVQYRSGRVSVQSGRQVKTRRPKIGLAGMVELAQRSSAHVELNVSVDSSGAVTNVEVARSSGSNNIDQPCRVAMYDWWFEPKKRPWRSRVPRHRQASDRRSR
jgi:TonB family protein